MAKRVSVNQVLINALETLLKKTDLDSIKVTDIIEEAGVSRTTFYRHFKDKYDLINWYYVQYMRELRAKYLESQDAYNLTLDLIRYFGEKREFFLKISGYHGQNSFLEYFMESMYKGDISYLKKRLRVEDLTPQQEYLVRFNSTGMISMVYDWMAQDCPQSAEELMEMLLMIMSPELKYYFMTSKDVFEAETFPE